MRQRKFECVKVGIDYYLFDYYWFNIYWFNIDWLICDLTKYLNRNSSSPQLSSDPFAYHLTLFIPYLEASSTSISTLNTMFSLLPPPLANFSYAYICLTFVFDIFQKGNLIIVPENFSSEDLKTTSNLAATLERKYTDENDVYHSEPKIDFSGAGRY